MELILYGIRILYVITCIVIAGILSEKLIMYAPDNVKLCIIEDVD